MPLVETPGMSDTARKHLERCITELWRVLQEKPTEYRRTMARLTDEHDALLEAEQKRKAAAQ